jgi:pimeloyl-ACP methyl ester carboxylesterase
MKNRAGVVGFTGVAPVLQKVHARRPDLRVHLAGHSFGGRVVSAAATGRDDDPVVPIASLTLLQAAFSHYGFAANWEPGRNGLFRGAFAGHRVVGPTLITHTANDKAVGIAYALASRVAGQVAAGLGDAGDKFGGIGRNGAQRTPEAVQARLLDVGGTYQLTAGKAHNLLADTFIASHSAVTGPQVAYALLSAVGTG